MGLGAGGGATGKFCNSYPHFCLEAVFSAPELIQNCMYIPVDYNPVDLP